MRLGDKRGARHISASMPAGRQAARSWRHPSAPRAGVVGRIASIRLPRAVGSVAAARHFVGRCLERWGHLNTEDAMLVTSELVSNAVQHAVGAIVVRLALLRAGLLLEVRDGSRLVPVAREPDLAGGRGLQVVDRLCVRWGVRWHDNGKIVWCELA
jgi:anti-sigma regulatory factor (Ser/Thr protein kinase)